MRKPSRLRTGLAVAALALSTGGVIAAATPAFAAATGCSDLRVCMYLSTPSNGHVYVQGWADHVSMTGYMTLTGPNGFKSRSATIYWKADKGNYEQWNNVSAVVGQYCVTFQQTDSFESSWKACESIT